MNGATVEIRLAVPARFHQVLKQVADLRGEKIEAYLLRWLIAGLDCDLQQPAGDQMHPLIEGRDPHDFEAELLELAGVAK